MSESINNQISSLRMMIKGDYTKIDPAIVDTLQENLNKDTERSKTALEYLLSKRGLTSKTIERFKLGYDEKRNAISIPNFKNGVLVNIKFRHLNPDEHNGIKYGSIRGAENWVFNEMGIQVGKEKGKLLIVEGEFCAMAAWQAGIRWVVSPGSGKDSYNAWLELVDTIPEVYIGYDNDAPGLKAARNMAEKIGIDKSKEVKYPDGVKDTDEFLLKHTREDFAKLIKDAKPYYEYEYVNLLSIFDDVKEQEEVLVSPYIPDVKIGKDWLMVLSGMSNIGKTSASLNIAIDFARRGIPSMIFPFERGISSVGKRVLQVAFDKSEDDFYTLSGKETDDIRKECGVLPLYLAHPKREQIVDTVRRAKRLFDVRFVVIDHLDYLCRGAGNKVDIMGEVLQNLKELAIEIGVVFLVIHHIRKLNNTDVDKTKIPTLDDLKGSSNVFQDPECVVMLYSDEKNTITVDVQKNKGTMSKHTFPIRLASGTIILNKPVYIANNREQTIDEKFEGF